MWKGGLPGDAFKISFGVSFGGMVGPVRNGLGKHLIGLAPLSIPGVAEARLTLQACMA